MSTFATHGAICFMAFLFSQFQPASGQTIQPDAGKISARAANNPGRPGTQPADDRCCRYWREATLSGSYSSRRRAANGNR